MTAAVPEPPGGRGERREAPPGSDVPSGGAPPESGGNGGGPREPPDDSWFLAAPQWRLLLVLTAGLAELVAAAVLLYGVGVPSDVREVVRSLYLDAAVFGLIALIVAAWDVFRIKPWPVPDDRSDAADNRRIRQRWRLRVGALALLLATLTLFSGLLTAAYAASDSPPARASSGPASVSVAGPGGGRKCGTDRWPVKTLSDPEAGAVNLKPKHATVSALGDLPQPDVPIGGKLARLSGIEHRTFTIRASLVADKFVTSDRDIHLVVADQDDPVRTMVVELSDPECAGVRDSLQFAEIASAREEFLRACGLPKTDFKDLSGAATITGVGFFDRIHGENRPIGRAPNGIELHPVIGFSDAGCSRGSKRSKV